MTIWCVTVCEALSLAYKTKFSHQKLGLILYSKHMAVALSDFSITILSEVVVKAKNPKTEHCLNKMG